METMSKRLALAVVGLLLGSTALATEAAAESLTQRLRDLKQRFELQEMDIPETTTDIDVENSVAIDNKIRRVRAQTRPTSLGRRTEVDAVVSGAQNLRVQPPAPGQRGNSDAARRLRDINRGRGAPGRENAVQFSAPAVVEPVAPVNVRPVQPIPVQPMKVRQLPVQRMKMREINIQ